MTRNMNTLSSLLLLAGALLSGCNMIPTAEIRDRDYRNIIGRSDKPMDNTMAVAPLLSVVKGRGQEGFEKASVVKRAGLEARLLSSLQQGRLLRKVIGLKQVDGKTLDGQAWSEGADLMLEVSVSELETKFERHNLLWIPNMLLWVNFLAPAWWIPTDVYRLELKADVRVRLIDQPTPLYQSSVTATAEGTFDEFDRGWRWFGLAAVLGEYFNSKSSWERISTKLYPAASSMLAQKVAVLLDRELRPIVEGKKFRSLSSRTMTLVAGVGSYDKNALPANPRAAASAKHFAGALAKTLGARYVKALGGAEATKARFLSSLRSHFQHLRANDRAYLYLAADSRAGAIMFYDAGQKGSPAGLLSIKELAAELGKLRGRVTLFLEADFKDLKLTASQLLQPLTKRGISVLCAVAPGKKIPPPADLDIGLFTFHLVRALGGRADANADKNLRVEEIAAYLLSRVRADSALSKGGVQELAVSLAGTPQ